MKLVITDDQKIDFIWHSNRIDSNVIAPEALERGTVVQTFNHNFGPTEIKNHILALNSALSYVNAKRVDIEHLILDTHKKLLSHVEGVHAGCYRTQGVWVGGYGTVDYKKIPAYVSRLQKMFFKIKNSEDCWNLHHEFETIHPFLDGNGRCGRLLAVFSHVRLGLPFPTILYEDRFEYYGKIQEYRNNKFKEMP